MPDNRNRKRPIQVKFFVDEHELELIKTRMAQVGTENMSAYLRKMAIDGYVINLDMPELRELTLRMKSISTSENQIAKRVNTTGSIYEADVEEIKKGEPVVFTALVTTKPEVKLGDYKGIEVEKIDHTVTDEDVDKDIEATQKKNARLITVDDRAIENGDIAVIDFEGFVDDVAFEGGKGEDYELEIGSGTFIPGFEDQLVGAETDADVDVKVTFPEEYHAENLAGKDAVFKVKVKEIKKRELPELDDDFASEVSEFDTMDEFRADVRKKLEEAAENKAKVETENAVIDKVIENAEFDLPDAMVETQIDNSVRDFAQRLSYQGMNLDMYMQYTGMTMDALRAQFTEQAKKQLSGSLVLEAIQKAEGIEAGPEEVELELVDMSKKYNMELDKLKELLGDAEKESIKKDLEIQKTITMIVNNAQVK